MRYQIVESSRAGRKQYLGRVKLTASYDRKALVDRMLERRPGLGKEAVTAVLMVLESTVADLCREGIAVRLEGFVRFCPTLTGAFAGRADSFESQRHGISVTAKMSPKFIRNVAAGISLRRVAPTVRTVQLLTVADHESGTENQVVTAGGIVTLRGNWLKVDPQDRRDHLVFQRLNDSGQTVPIPKPFSAGQRELVFTMPKVSFDQGVFVITNHQGTPRPRSGSSQPVKVTSEAQ